MGDDILIVAPTQIPDLTKLVDSISNEYDGSSIIIYALGNKCERFNEQLRKIEYSQCFFDIDIDIDNSSLEYLRDFEEGISPQHILNDVIYTDRKLSKDGQVGVFNDNIQTLSHEEIIDFLGGRIKFIENIFEKYDFKFIFSYMAQMAPSMIVYELSKRESIPFFRPHHSRIKNLRIIYDDIYEYSDVVWNRAEKILSNKSISDSFNQASKFISDVQSGDNLYYNDINRDSPDIWERLYHAGEVMHWERSGITTQYYYDTPKIKYFSKVLKKQINKKLLNLGDKFQRSIPEQPYVYFPFHAQPELTLMMWTKYYTNQKELAKQVSKSLPIDTKLVVNDHPVQWGARDRGFYSELINTYNIEVMDINVSTQKIIENAEVVFTITSSAGFEALIYDTPVVTIGREKYAPFYANFDFVNTVDNPYEIHESIKDSTNNSTDYDRLAAYIAAILELGSSPSEPNHEQVYVEQIKNYLS